MTLGDEKLESGGKRISMKCLAVLTQRMHVTYRHTDRHTDRNAIAYVPVLAQLCMGKKNRKSFSRVMITKALPPFYDSQCKLALPNMNIFKYD